MGSAARLSRFVRVAFPVTVAAVVLLAWPASYLVEMHGGVTAAGRHGAVDAGPGWFAATVRAARPADRAAGGSWRPLTAARRDELAYPRIYSAPGDYHFYTPFWVAELAVALAAGAIVATRRMVARPAGVCRTCGYDLRATPDRCPECGTVITRT